MPHYGALDAICPETQFRLSHQSATGQEKLALGQAQGLELSVVVKDAARGIAAGVSEVFPRAEQRDDCFHLLYEMNKVRRRLERRAYGAIEREGEALGRLGKIRAYDKARRRKTKRELSSVRRGCALVFG